MVSTQTAAELTFGQGFLTEAAVFPREIEGQAWGPCSLAIDLPGGPFAVTGLERAQAAAIGEHFAPFVRDLLPQDQPTAKVGVHTVEPCWFHRREPTGWVYSLEVDISAEVVRVAGYDFLGRLEWQPALIAGIWTYEQGAAILGAVENLLRVVAAYAVLASNGVVVHSAAIARDRRAWLFPGCSGSGKSTLSRLAAEQGWTVLGDDLNVLRARDDELLVEQVPFAGDLGRQRGVTEPVPLAGVGSLTKDTADRIEAMPPSRCLALLLASSPYINVDPHRRDLLLARLHAVVQRTRAFGLHFSLDGRLAGLEALATMEEKNER